MTDTHLTIKNRLEILIRIVIVLVIIVAMVFFSINYATFSHSGIDEYEIKVLYHPTNRGSVVIDTPSIGMDGIILPIRITGLFTDVNYSFWVEPWTGNNRLRFFSNVSERTFWTQIFYPDQQWLLCREYLNETVLVARIYLI